MKATGIVRRIDDLGRVVIPKEIRRTMRIREGDPLYTSLLHTLKPASLLGFPAFSQTPLFGSQTSFKRLFTLFNEIIRVKTKVFLKGKF